MTGVSELLIATKIRIPPVHDNLVSRPRLVQKLNEGLARIDRLILISAPAGYGKSTLLSEWVAQVELPVAWLSLESSENDPVRFWSYFLKALSSLPQQSGIFEDMHLALQSPKPPVMEELLDSLLNELSQLTSGALLVLDDLHVISDSHIHHNLIYLIDHLSKSTNSLRLVIASRMDPPWPLARWRVRNELTELRSADMRFSSSEADQFLSQTLQLKLSPQDISTLQDRTEGWIAGLQLATITMQGWLQAQGRQGVSRFIENFAGTNRFIMDYLMEEVISQQPAERRDFLQATSILAQFTAPLCDALLQRKDSQAILEQIEQVNLFLIPLDDERQWYRYHHLFTELLHKQLKQTQPERISELHRLASEWFAENHFMAEAIDHALDAGDVAQVNRFISGNALAMIEYVELLDVLRHFEQMPEEEIISKPWLCVAYVWVKAYVSPTGDIDQVMLKAMQSVNGVEDALEKQHLESHLDAVWAYVAWVKGKAALALEFLHTALENLPEDDWMTRAHLLNLEGLSLQNVDRIPEAIQSFEAAVRAGQRTGKPAESFHAYTNLAFTEIIRGNLRQAYSLCQNVLILADQAGLLSKGLPVLAYAYATMSMVQCEWNRLESAVAFARQSVALAERWSQADTLHFSLTCLVESLRASGEFDEALSVNQRAMNLATMVSPWYTQISLRDEVLINLAKGDLETAARRHAQLEATYDSYNRNSLLITSKAPLLNAQGRFIENLTEIEKVLSEVEQKGKIWVLMKLLPLQALALNALERRNEAFEVIGRCLVFAKAESYVRTFVDLGEPMYRLLQAAAKRGIASEYIYELLPAFKIDESLQRPITSKIQTKGQHPALVEPLSEREIQVLHLLDSPLTSEEIGRELYISTNTVRTHIKNIYTKLGVNRRAEAVALAKQYQLM